MTAFTTSWDDGHPLDLRIAELLTSYGFRGTFYVPRRNREGRSVLSRRELALLGAQFEIGGHSYDHVRLTELPPDEAAHQVHAIKAALEDELGRPIAGFCYPRGAHDAAVRQLVRAAGFRYARTIENLWLAGPTDPFQLPTTLQLYPHSRVTYVKNLARGGHLFARARSAEVVLRGRPLGEVLRALLDRALVANGVFHLWGHAWELEEHGLWGELEAFLAYARDRVPHAQRVDNAALIAAMNADSQRSRV
jgi:peptidoglycan/xylan/chitin deacetylase (PgdA/CDA1 family)